MKRKITNFLLVFVLFAFSANAQVDVNFTKVRTKVKSKEYANKNLHKSKSMKHTRSRGTIFSDDFETSTSWTLESPFEIGVTTTEPDVAHSGTQILGGPLNGNYSNDISAPLYATSPVIDCSAQTAVILSYWSFSGCESSNYDHIGVEVFNGTDWVEIWSNQEWSGSNQENEWTYYEFDVTAHAAGVANFQVRYYLGGTDNIANYSGWGIDDFIVFYPEDNDLGVNAITPSGVVNTGSTITPTVTIKNFGTVAQSTYDITLVSTPAGYNETVSNPGSVSYGETLTVDFPAWTPADDNYTLTATVVLTGDANSANDVATSDIEVRALVFGDLVYSFNATSASQVGVETNGEYIYTVKFNAPDIYKYTMGGVFLESFTIDGVDNSIDLAYNSTTGYFYGNSYNVDVVNEMDFENQTRVSTITPPVKSYGLIYDDDNNTFWGVEWEDPITEFDITGTATGNTITHPTSVLGLAYDNFSDPANPTIWMFTNSEAPDDYIVEYNMDGTATGRQIDVTNVPRYSGDESSGGGLATYVDANNDAYLIANIQQTPNLIAIFYLATLPTYTVTFNVTDGTNPLQDVDIAINGENITTDATGVATIELADGDYPWTATLAGYENETGSVTVNGALQTVDITMETGNTVTFNITDGTAPLQDVDIAINGGNITTDATGVATIDLTNGDYDWTATLAGYENETGTVTVNGAPQTVDIEMTPATINYTVTFIVTDGTNPLQGVNIAINGENITTDATGVATIELADGDYNWTATLAGYQNEFWTLTVNGAPQTIEFEMTQVYTVTFNVTDGTNPLQGVDIAINGENLTTDATGGATIDLVDEYYPWTATLANYNQATGSVTVDGADETVDINMTVSNINDLENNIVFIYPNPTNGKLTIEIEDNYHLEVIDIAGKVVYKKELTELVNNIDLTEQNAGNYIIRLTKDKDNKIINHKIIIK